MLGPVHMHSVFGNFIKSCVTLFSLLALIGVYFKWITVIEFVYVTAGIYFLAFIVTMLYAFYLKTKFQFSIPIMPKIMVYTFFIILSGSVATFGY
jgi:hypothetical protein